MAEALASAPYLSEGGYVGNCIAVTVLLIDNWLTGYRAVKLSSFQTLNLHIKWETHAQRNKTSWEHTGFYKGDKFEQLALIMEFSGLLRAIWTSLTARSKWMDTVSIQNLLHLHAHFSWAALSITNPVIDGHLHPASTAGEECWQRQWVPEPGSHSSFLPRSWTHRAWSEAPCRNQNHPRSPLWQLWASKAVQNTLERKKRGRAQIKLKPSHGAQQWQAALTRNPAKTRGTSFR